MRRFDFISKFHVIVPFLFFQWNVVYAIILPNAT